MNRKEASFELRVVCDIGNIPRKAGTVQKNVIARNIRELLEPGCI